MPDETKETLPEPKPARHPKELSSEYHKAHKQLMLWAAILFIWELVGVDLGKAKDVGGNIGPIVTVLKSPQAVPWALLILVIYFLFKCTVEWAQCHPERRTVRFARIDFISAWIVALAAIGLYVGQAMSRVQLANVIQGSTKFDSTVEGIFAGVVLVISAHILWAGHKNKRKRKELVLFSLIAIFLPTAIMGLFYWRKPIIWGWFLFGFGIGAGLIIFLSIADSKPKFRSLFGVLPKK
jgi:hypothetical protein